MLKIFNSINRQLKSSSSIKLFVTKNSSIKKHALPTTNRLINFYTTSTPKHNLFPNSFSHTNIPNFSFRRFSSISSPRTESMVNYQASLSSEVSGLKKKHLLPSIPVRAYCLTDRIDLEGLMVENQANLVPHAPGTGRYAVLKFDDLANSRAHPDLGAKLTGISHSYMVVFPYGSVTMFNVHDHEVGRYLEIIKRHATRSLLDMIKCGGDSSHNYIDYEVREQPDLHTWMQGGPNHIMLQRLNIDGICTIGSVLGQSVALDYYCCLVDELVKEYSPVNIGLEGSGTCRSWIKQIILLCKTQEIATAIYRFWLSERSDIAGKEDTKDAQMLDYLLDNFNLAQRFKGLDRKFKIGELNNDIVAERLKQLFATMSGVFIFICLALISFSPLGLLLSILKRVERLIPLVSLE